MGKVLGQTTSTNMPVTSDPVLGLMLEKGMITEDEAAKVQAQVDALRTNPIAQMPPSKWNISSGIKSLELFGDLRLRYEYRSATDPREASINLDRLRYAVRLGLRGDLFDDYYYGLRVDTSANPRSPFVTFGAPGVTSPGSTPYSGPFGKSSAGINIGQLYFGWHPESWFELTLGKMPNPLYTTPMVWSSALNPEGAAEHLKYTIGQADFFANFGQFLYADTSPNNASPGYFNLVNTDDGTGSMPFLLAFQGGVTEHFTKQVSFKVAPALYLYTRFSNGHTPNNNPGFSPDFSGTYVGQGSTVGVNNTPAFYNLANGTPGFDGFYANQTGINNLMVLEIPFELNVQMRHYDFRFFGDFAENLDGRARAMAAFNAAHSTYFSSAGTAVALDQISSPQIHDNKAFEVGVAFGSSGSLGLVNGTTAKKNAWEVRTYFQHVEQYALDPNLIDLDFFSGVENMQGVYFAAAYGLTDNLIGTVRYGYADRINDKLGTGGAGTDIPQMNPIDRYSLFQVDLTLKF